MSRAKYRDVAYQKSETGVLSVVPYPEITVFETGTTTPVAQQLYAGATGPTTLGNPFTGNADGSFAFFLDDPQAVTLSIDGSSSLLAIVSLDGELVQADMNAAIKVGPDGSLMAVGGTVGTGEKGVELGHVTDSMGGAVTLDAKSASTRYPLHINPIAVGDDPLGHVTAFGHKLYSGGAIDYIAAVTYRTSRAQWGGLLIDAETTDVSGTSDTTGGDVNGMKIVMTDRTNDSWTRMRGLEIEVDRYGTGAAGTAPNNAPSRGVDVGVFVDSDCPAGANPFDYTGYYVVSRNSGLFGGGRFSRQANAGYYVGGRVGSGGASAGFAYGFYHDLAEPVPVSIGGVPDPAFYSTGSGDIFVKRGINVGTGAAASATIPLYILKTTAGADNSALVFHSNNSDVNSHAFWWARAGGASGGDAYTRYTIDGATEWTAGIDNSASDAFVIARSSTLGTNNALSISTANVVSLPTGVLALGATPAASGDIRLSKAATVKGLNNAGSGDLTVYRTDTADNLNFGDTTAVASHFYLATVGYTWRLGATDHMSLTTSGVILGAAADTLGFFGAAGTTKGTFTQTYSTADATLGAYTSDLESAAYTSTPAALVNAATLVDLNALRTAYEVVRVHHEDLAQFVNAVVDRLQLHGLVA